ncbi:MAG: hypothetical protein AAF635_14315, partial [Cyanobacteria bacterium P01_C01_bin.69]
KSFHYKLARQLEQLAPAQVIVCATVAEQLAQERLTAGQQWGDIKYSKLSSICYPSLSFLGSVQSK